MRFSAGLENPGLKPVLRNEMLFRWTEVQLPLLKQGAPTRFGVDDIGAFFSGSHADSSGRPLSSRNNCGFGMTTRRVVIRWGRFA
jgi:hypothetical protein